MIKKFEEFETSGGYSKNLLDRLNGLRDIWEDIDLYLGVQIKYETKFLDSGGYNFYFDISDLIWDKDREEIIKKRPSIKKLLFNEESINKLPIMINLIFEEPPNLEFIDRLIQLSGITEKQLGLSLKEWVVYSKSYRNLQWGMGGVKILPSLFDFPDGRFKEVWSPEPNILLENIRGIYLTYIT